MTLGAAPGVMCVLDTNVMLHCRAVAEIPWARLLGSDAARLILPLRVIEELDAKKSSRRKDLARRASKVLARLEEVLREDPIRPAVLVPGVTVEVLLREDHGERLLDADEEILRACANLHQLTGRPITVATGDTSMKLRSRVKDVKVLGLPDEFRLTLAADDNAAVAGAANPN